VKEVVSAKVSVAVLAIVVVMDTVMSSLIMIDPSKARLPEPDSWVGWSCEAKSDVRTCLASATYNRARIDSHSARSVDCDVVREGGSRKCERSYHDKDKHTKRQRMHYQQEGLHRLSPQSREARLHWDRLRWLQIHSESWSHQFCQETTQTRAYLR